MLVTWLPGAFALRLHRGDDGEPAARGGGMPGGVGGRIGP